MYHLKYEEQNVVRRTYNKEMEKIDENLSEQINQSKFGCWIESEDRDEYLELPDMVRGEEILKELVENEEMSFEDVESDGIGQIVSERPSIRGDK